MKWNLPTDRHGAWFPAPVRAGIDGAVVEFTDAAGQKTVELLENGTARVRAQTTGVAVIAASVAGWTGHASIVVVP